MSSLNGKPIKSTEQKVNLKVYAQNWEKIFNKAMEDDSDDVLTWHYGLIRTPLDKSDKPVYSYNVHEIFNIGKKDPSWTENPIALEGIDKEDLISDVSMILMDIKTYPVYEIKNDKLVEVKE